jgi:diadenylate cyclase
MNLFEISFIKFTLTDLFDLVLISFIFSYAYSYFRGTRGGQMLIGLLILFFAGFVVNILGFRATSWLLNLFQTVWVVVFVILFQPEIRRLLTSVGQNRILRKLFQIEKLSIQEEIIACISEIKRNKWGAIIIFERENSLKTISADGVRMGAVFSPELLVSIFNPTSPLHDGAVIIHSNIIEAAACILPLTESKTLNPEMGTRHRAALGISEESDSLALVLSEETGKISIAENGYFISSALTLEELGNVLKEKMSDIGDE